METKFLTPIQLWQDFNPIKDLLETAITSYSKLEEEITCKSFYFTAIGSGDNSVRVFGEVYVPLKHTSKAVILVSDTSKGIPHESLLSFAQKGYISASVDLSGVKRKGVVDYTKYKGTYSYGQYDESRKNLKNCSPTAEACPAFLWSRIVRRLLTVLQEDYPNIKPICIAEYNASEVAWHLAAMDTRIAGSVTMLGRSFGNYVGWNKSTREEPDDNNDRWETAISASAYAKFVGCPMLIVTATNSSSGEFDRLSDIVGLIPKQITSHILVAPRQSKQITKEIDNTVFRWIESQYESKKALPKVPVLTYHAEESLVLKLTLEEVKNITQVRLYYAYNEELPECRNWYQVDMVKSEEYTASIDISEEDNLLYAYAVVEYKNIEISSLPIMINLDKQEIKRSKLPKVKLIYDTSMENCFFAETEGVVLPKDTLAIKKSEIGISGIGVNKGTLATYSIGETRRLKRGGILQISAYSLGAKDIIIRIYSHIEGQYIQYSASRQIEGGDWEKLFFEATDFRTEERLPMEDWKGIKKIEFINSEDVLFNNMLWV